MNLEPPDLRIPLQPRSHLLCALAAGVLLATTAAYLWDPILAVVFASAAAIFIPAAILGALCRFVWNARDSADRRGRAERMSREVLQA